MAAASMEVETTDTIPIPEYYKELNDIWSKHKPIELKKYEGNTDLVLTDTYDIALPDVGVDTATQEKMLTVYSREIIPVFEVVKSKEEYKIIQIILAWKMSELRYGPPPTLAYIDTKVEFTNEKEIERYISRQKPRKKQEKLRLELYEIKGEIDILNSKRETYDTVVYLDLHGVLLEESVDGPTIDFGLKMTKAGYCTPGLYPVCGVPEFSDSNFTFITATKPGVINIEDLATFSGQVETIVNRQLRTRNIDILELQKEFRQLKQKFILDTNAKYSAQQKLELFKGDWENYERDKGWGITKNKWLNKKLLPDPKFGIPVRILYDESGKTPLDKTHLFDRILEANGRNTHALRADKELSITTNELVQYLIDAGRKNVLIIDTSCFEQRLYDDERTERRLVRESVKHGVTGLGGTRKNKRTKRKTKRFKRR